MGGEGRRSGDSEQAYLPLAEYGLISDRRSAALVSGSGSIDWCCMPRFDSGSLFARLLDAKKGGHWSLAPRAAAGEQRYLEGTLVLETRFRGEDGEGRLLDFFAPPGDAPGPTVVRIFEATEGAVDLDVSLAPRFDYGSVAPWIREQDGVWAAIGGDDGLLIRSEAELEFDGRHRLRASMRVEEGGRLRMEAAFRRPVELDSLEGFEPIDAEAVDRCFDETLAWWREWPTCIEAAVAESYPDVVRSALTLKALSYEPTGAIAAAATTSLPEALALSGERNWDYRFSWVRDSALAVRSLAELGCDADADAFRRFIERSAAGNAKDLQIMFGVGGERRLGEQELDGLDGWCGAAPVRVGNEAAAQLQLDAFGQLVDQSWRWHRRGNSPDHDYWVFIADLVDAAIEHWRDPDRGIWEWRGEPRHFVHSKALAWSAVDRGIRLGEDCGKDVPDRWRQARDEIRETVQARGFDERRGSFRMDFDHDDIDASLLRLPVAGFVPWNDERMIATADAVRERLDFDGLLRRYDADDGMPEEGAFVACSFWLATCLARQGRIDEAKRAFSRAAETAGGLGLYSEEYDPRAGRMLGNYPLALTHLSHIEAAVALSGGRSKALDD